MCQILVRLLVLLAAMFCQLLQSARELSKCCSVLPEPSKTPVARELVYKFAVVIIDGHVSGTSHKIEVVIVFLNACLEILPCNLGLFRTGYTAQILFVISYQLAYELCSMPCC
jgi:hypothetical protein